MDITFDPEKNERNVIERELPFSLVSELDWGNARVIEDVRHDYPERRYIAMAYLRDRLHVVCFSQTETGIRVISFRKANKREIKADEQATFNQ